MKKPYKYVRARCSNPTCHSRLRIGQGESSVVGMILRRKILYKFFYTNIMTYQIDQSGKLRAQVN